MVEIRLAPLKPKEAMAYFRSKGLAPPDQRFDYRDVWKEGHASSFVVAKVMQDDVLKLLKDGIATAKDQGQSFGMFAAELEPALRQKGWWGKQEIADPLTGETQIVRTGSMQRLRVIFDTNMRGAAAAGRWAAIQRGKAAFPYLRYRQIDRPSRRLQHARFDGLVRPVDDPVWTRIYPPNGWFCGCWVERITQGQVDRGEVVVSPSFDLEEVEWENRRTGETEMVPLGIHPGFDTNPGMIWLDTSRRMEAIEGQDNAAALKGVATQLRLNALRDGFESGAFVDRDGQVRAVVRGSRENPGGLTWSPIDAFRGADFIHTHPMEGVFSGVDFESFYEAGVRSMAFLTPGGSFGSVWALDMNSYAALRRAFSKLILSKGELLAGLSGPDRNLVISHAWGLWLDQSGVAAYILNPTGALSDDLARLAPFIVDLVNARRPG